MKIALIGYGKMGMRIEKIARMAGHEISAIIDTNNPEVTASDPIRAVRNADVIIDFSHPEGVSEHISWALSAETPMVIGTTGWNRDPNLSQLAKAHQTPLLYGSNFSLGVQLFMKLTRHAAALFGSSPLFHAALHELHHTEKVDFPSGTAKTISEIWRKQSTLQKEECFDLPDNRAVDKNHLYVTAQRLGSVFGEHSLRINSEFDDIEITHRARSRDGFASGAVKAAEWLTNQAPGFYLVEDVVEKILN